MAWKTPEKADWADLGVWVGGTAPTSPKTVGEWQRQRTGYFAWLDVSAVSQALSISPAAASMLLEMGIPTVDVGGAILIAPSAASMLLAAGVPSVVVDRVIAPTAAAMTMAAGTPTVVTSGDTVVGPTAAAMLVACGTPLVVPGLAIWPSVASMAMAAPVPNVAVGDTASATFVAISAPMGGKSPPANDGQEAAYSTNSGASWTSALLPSAATWRAVCWNGSVFCAVGSGGAVATSPTGAAWTGRNAGTAREWTCVGSNGTGRLVAVEGGTSTPYVAYSDNNGASWTQAQINVVSGGARNIAWNGSVFAIVCDSATPAVMTSANGESWARYTMSSIGGAASLIAALGSGRLVVVGSNVRSTAHSTNDGATWTVNSTVLPASRNWKCIASTGTTFSVIAGGSAETSTDGATWSDNTVTETSNFVGEAWDGSAFCAVFGATTGSTLAYTSSNGASWTARTLPVSANWTAIAGHGA